MPTVLITGSTSGHGRDVALELATAGWSVIVHGRSRDRGATVLREIRAAGSPEARLAIADIAAPAAARQLAGEVGAVDVLCNAARHYLGAFLLSRLIDVGERIVNLTATEQRAIDFRHPDAIAHSALAPVMFTFSLAERLAGTTVNAVAPAAEGVRATVRAIADPALAGVTGRYFRGLSEARAHDQAYDAGARERLWTLSEQLTG